METVQSHYALKCLFLVPHVQALRGLRPGQGVPWVQEVHVLRQVQKVRAFQPLPLGNTFSRLMSQNTVSWDVCLFFSTSYTKYIFLLLSVF